MVFIICDFHFEIN